jgi:hypothetical protein
MVEQMVTLIDATPGAMARSTRPLSDGAAFACWPTGRGAALEAEFRGGITRECVHRLATVIGLAVDAGSTGFWSPVLGASFALDAARPTVAGAPASPRRP